MKISRVFIFSIFFFMSACSSPAPATPTATATLEVSPTISALNFEPSLPTLLQSQTASDSSDTPPEFTSGFTPAISPPEYTNANVGGPVSEYWRDIAALNEAWARYSIQRSQGESIDKITGASQEEVDAKFIEMMSGVVAKIFQIESPDGLQMVSIAVTEDGSKNQTMYIGVEKTTGLPYARPDGWMFDPANSEVVAKPLPKGTVYGGQWGVDDNYYSFAVDPKTGIATHWFDTTKGSGEWVEVVYEPTFSYLSSSEKLGAAVQELLDNGACDVDVENPDNRMHYADGTPVPFGLLQTEKQGEVTWYYVSGVLCQGSVNVGATDSNYSEGVMPLVLIPGEKGNQIIITPFIDDDPFPQTMMFVSGPISQKSMIDTVVQKNAEIHQSTFARMARFIEAGVQNADSPLVGKQVILIFNTTTPKAVNFEKKNATIQTVLDMIAGKKSGAVGVKSLLELLTLYTPDLGGRP